MKITRDKYKEILEIQGISFNENSRWFTNSLDRINEALNIGDVVKCTCEPHKPTTKWKDNKVVWSCEICKKPC